MGEMSILQEVAACAKTLHHVEISQDSLLIRHDAIGPEYKPALVWQLGSSAESIYFSDRPTPCFTLRSRADFDAFLANEVPTSVEPSIGRTCPSQRGLFLDRNAGP